MSHTSAVRSPDQNRRIWGLLKELQRRSGIPDEDTQAVLRRHCLKVSRQEHSSKLTERQAQQVIELMQSEISGYRPVTPPKPEPAGHEPWGERGPGPRCGRRVTPREQEVLLAMFQQAGMTSREQQMGFCRRQCKVPWPQTMEHADALMEPLKAIILRSVTSEELEKRVAALQNRPELDAWKKGFVEERMRRFAEAKASHKSAKSVMSPHQLLKLIECEVACGLMGGSA